MAPPSARTKIIDAALALVRQQGAAKLTLDEAAKQAGLSKGGVLYHFKSKDDLIRAMVQRLIDQCDELSQQYYQQEAPGPYRWARTVLRISYDPNGPVDDPINAALLAVIATNPELLAPLQDMYAVWRERMDQDGTDPGLSHLIGMAMDGLLFARMLNLVPKGHPCLEQARQTILTLLNQATEPTR